MNPFPTSDSGPEPEAWVKAREQLAKLSPNNFAKPTIPFGYGGYANQGYDYYNFLNNCYSYTLPSSQMTSDGAQLSMYPAKDYGNFATAPLPMTSSVRNSYPSTSLSQPSRVDVSSNSSTNQEFLNKPYQISPQVNTPSYYYSSSSMQTQPTPSAPSSNAYATSASYYNPQGSSQVANTSQIPKHNSLATQESANYSTTRSYQPRESHVYTQRDSTVDTSSTPGTIKFNLPKQKILKSSYESDTNDTEISDTTKYDDSYKYSASNNRMACKESAKRSISKNESFYSSESSENLTFQAGTTNRKVESSKSPPSAKNSTLSIDDWPQSLKHYVNRAFMRCQSDSDKDYIQEILKQKLMSLAQRKDIYKIDWDNEPLPTVDKKGLSSPETYGQKKRKSKNQKRLKKKKRKTPSPLSIYKTSTSDSSSPDIRSRASNRRPKSSEDSDSDFIPLDEGKSKKPLNSTVAHVTGRRFSRKERRQKQLKESSILNSDLQDDPEVIAKRKARFESFKSTGSHPPIKISNKNFWDTVTSRSHDSTVPIVGTCTDLEKPYLRLTSAANPSSVRPQHVLEQSLVMAVSHWAKTKDYHHVCDQLKSIRQDLTVQMIRNDFTVKVYETHAKIALEKGDPGEFNQCQSQLLVLYDKIPSQNRLEFTAYLILYSIYSNNLIGLQTCLRHIDQNDSRNEVVNHALQVRRAWTLGNYHSLFKLFRSAPAMSGNLMSWFIGRERKNALKVMIKAYRPTLSLQYLRNELEFKSMDQMKQFLSQFNIVYIDGEAIDCKSSSIIA